MRIEERFLLLLLRTVREVKINGLAPGGRIYLLARVLEGAGLLRSARWAYGAAFRAARRSNRRQAFRVLQWRQFHLERLNHRLGEPRVDDPLFRTGLTGVEDGSRPPTEDVAGYFGIDRSYSGLRFDLVLTSNGDERVQLLLDGRVLRTMVPKKRRLFPAFFRFALKRPALRAFPERGEIEFRTESGRPLTRMGARRVEVTYPGGDGTIHQSLGEGPVIDKKGYPIESDADLALKQSRFLEIYDAARAAFDEVVGTPLFLMYGTLLGHVREGDFIPGDDDFDVGYFSEETTTDAVREEAKEIVVRLVRAGFTVTFNCFGRLFRLKVTGEDPDLHLDVRPLWYERGRIWAHKQASLACTPDDFVPVERGIFRSTPAYVPRNAEGFLEAYYGPGWRVPDPGYSNESVKIPTWVTRHLDRTCVTPRDLREMEREIERGRNEGESPGRLISLGSHSLYPLEEYERHCEWSV